MTIKNHILEKLILTSVLYYAEYDINLFYYLHFYKVMILENVVHKYNHS